MALASVSDAPNRITAALQRASQATGIDFNYLLKTAERESSLRPTAKARSSSAAGLFQFIENTWLKTIKQEGARFGLSGAASEIRQTSSGRYVVPDRAMRAEILALRYNPEISALLAGAFTQQNTEIMSERLGRDPTQGELYIAHFMGAETGAKLVNLANSDPRDRADVHFPRAARANPSIFYSRRGPRSTAEVYRTLVAKHSSEPVVVAQAARGEPAGSRQVSDVVAAAVASGNPADPVFQARPASVAGLGAIGAWQAIVMSEAESVVAARAGAISSPAEAPAPARMFQGSFWEQLRRGQEQG